MRDADYDEILPCCNCLKLWCGRQYHRRDPNDSDTSADPEGEGDVVKK